jgi:MYXO-CTERM domain-containing protein
VDSGSGGNTDLGTEPGADAGFTPDDSGLMEPPRDDAGNLLGRDGGLRPGAINTMGDDVLSGGCGCRAAESAGSRSSAAIGLLLVLLGAFLRRRVKTPSGRE